MNSTVDVHPVIVLIALPAGIALFGFLGLLALLPVTVFGLAVSRSVVAALDLAPTVAAHVAADAAEAAQAAGDHGPGSAPGRAGPTLLPDPAAEVPEGVPVWLDRIAQWSWRILVLAALAGLVIALVVRIPAVVVPGVMAVVAAATLRPAVRHWVRRGWGRGRASAVATVGTAIAILAISMLAVIMLVGSLQQVIGTAADGAAQAQLQWLRDLIQQVGAGVQVDLGVVFLDILALAFAVLLATLLTFFFLRDGPRMWRRGMRRLAPGRKEPMDLAGHRAADVLAGYMIGTTAISAFGAATTGLVLAILGLPLALPITVISFFAGYIPYVGSFVATGLSLLITIPLGTTTDVVIMMIFTVVFNIVQGNIVTPLVYGKSVSLHPAVVLMAVPVGNEIAGIMGMFLVVPVAGMIATTWRLLIAAIDQAGIPPDRQADRSPADGAAGATGGGDPPAVEPAPAGT